MTTKRNRTYTAPRRRDSAGLLTELWTVARHAREMYFMSERDDHAVGDVQYWGNRAVDYERWARWVAAVLDAGRKGETP